MKIKQRVVVCFQTEAHIENACPVWADAYPIRSRIRHHTSTQMRPFELAALYEKDHAIAAGSWPHVHRRKVKLHARFEQELQARWAVRVPIGRVGFEIIKHLDFSSSCRRGF